MIKITKKNIRETFKDYGYDLIEKTWYKNDDNNLVLCSVVADCGVIYSCAIHKNGKATMQMLSDIMVHKEFNIDYMFK